MKSVCISHELPRRWYRHADMGKLAGRAAYIYEHERRGDPCQDVLPGEVGIFESFRFIQTE